MDKFIFMIFVSLTTAMGFTSAYKEAVTEVADERWSSYCDPQLGCLTLTSQWSSIIDRPVNLLPWPRNKIMTKFSLHTREAPNGNVYLFANDTASITNSTFKPSRPTKFLTHGFLNTGYEAIFQNITKNLLINGDYNVIVTHWGPGAGSSFTDYFQAVANTRVVGLEIAYLVNAIVKNVGVSTTNVHLIGHSLGSHISGYAGEKIKNLGRITGLDPAGPFFSDMDPIVRLDPSDASFVDNIHTGAAFGGVGPGTLQPMGHVDIYANGGEVQPGCNNVSSSSLPFYELAKAELDTLDCSHGRSLEIFRDSLVSNCQAVAYECTDNDAFQQGKCYSCGTDNTHCAPVGLLSHLYPIRTRTNIQLYYTTSDTTPFCQYQYAVQISVSSKIWSAPKEVYGVVSVSVNTGAANFNLIAVPNTDTTFQLGQQKTLLMTSSVNMGKISSLTLFWTPTSGILNNIYCYFYDCSLYVANVTISSLNQYPEAGRLANTFNGCPASSTKYTTIAPKSYAIFNAKNGLLPCD